MSGEGTDTVEVLANMMDSTKLPNSITVLITGAGGAATPGLIKRLKSQYDFRIVAVDMDRFASGLYWADKGYVVPPGNSPRFLPVMREICKREQVGVVVPLVDEELVSVSELESDGIVVLLPRREFVRTCLDKFVLMSELRQFNIPVPSTWLAPVALFSYVGSSRNVGFPLIVKPRVGRGSRGVVVVNSPSELNNYKDKVDNDGKQTHEAGSLLVQSYIDGTEFTVSVVVWRDGEVQVVVPKEIVCKKGVTRIAVTRYNKDIDILCRKIQEALHADGPFNVQLRIDKNSGVPMVFEINPRFSTTTSLTTAAGVDEVGVLICQAMNPTYPKLRNEWREGVTLIRRTMDDFVGEPYLSYSRITDMSGETLSC